MWPQCSSIGSARTPRLTAFCLAIVSLLGTPLAPVPAAAEVAERRDMMVIGRLTCLTRKVSPERADLDCVVVVRNGPGETYGSTLPGLEGGLVFEWDVHAPFFNLLSIGDVKYVEVPYEPAALAGDYAPAPRGLGHGPNDLVGGTNIPIACKADRDTKLPTCSRTSQYLLAPTNSNAASRTSFKLTWPHVFVLSGPGDDRPLAPGLSPMTQEN